MWGNEIPEPYYQNILFGIKEIKDVHILQGICRIGGCSANWFKVRRPKTMNREHLLLQINWFYSYCYPIYPTFWITSKTVNFTLILQFFYKNTANEKETEKKERNFTDTNINTHKCSLMLSQNLGYMYNSKSSIRAWVESGRELISNWHLKEIYLFFLFMFFLPKLFHSFSRINL